jgi:tripartite-type tricarboxylate transporter receptor subunit TctC
MASRCARWISLLLVAIAGAAWAQPYPSRPVRILVGYAPGGSVDMVARLMAQKLTASFGQPVLVENRPGAASNIAGDITAKSPPDGYTLLISGGGALSTNAAIYAKMPYDPLKDLGPIALLVHQGNVLIVNPSLPPRSVKEFIALAQSRPGKLNYGTGGNGSNQHLATELFTMMAGLKLVHVPYKGGAPAMTDLVGGQIEFMFQTIPEAIQHIKSARVRALGVTGLKRSAALPDVPTIDEAGLPGYSYEGFIGMVGPAGMPKEIVARLSSEVAKALASSDVQARLLELGLESGSGTPEQFGAYLREQSVQAFKLAKDMGIKPVD